MTTDEDIGMELFHTLESHEVEVKRTIESLGQLQAELERTAESVQSDAAMDRLTQLGQCLANHENHLQAVVQTLDDHKTVVRSVDDTDRTALEEAMSQARAQARQESHPPDPEFHDENA